MIKEEVTVEGNDKKKIIKRTLTDTESGESWSTYSIAESLGRELTG